MEPAGRLGVPGPEVSVRMFRNGALEALTHMHPATPWFLGVPVAAALTVWAFLRGVAPLTFAGLLVAGLASWTLIEYVMHRFIFHYEPRTGWGRKVHFLVHGVHHDYPNDATRLVMPPVLSIPLGVVTFGALALTVGVPYANAVFCGMITGYVAYDTIHYMTHHRPMRGPVGRFLKRYHMRHHFADPQRGYGVSTPVWDFVFRTRPKRE